MTTLRIPAPAESQLAAPVEVALLRARGAATLCGVGLATWWRWDAAGRVPHGVKIGGARLWSREELLDWIRAGCPERVEWQARREAELKRVR
jgi:predicted DNA-binding transcriptional regulator AlpA